MNWNGKKVLVVGAGKTGLAAADFLGQKNALVTLTDEKPRENFQNLPTHLASLGVTFALGAYPAVEPKDWDLVLVSPGVSPLVPPIQAAYQKGIPVWGELEVAFGHTTAPMVAITGTNGKTTTTTLVGEICQRAGFKTLVAGNIGRPLLEGVEAYGAGDVIVAEVSSFQLETIHQFRPKVAVVLNITPDHLDRHKTMEAYCQAKARIFANQGPDDYTVLNADDPLVRSMAELTKGKVIFFSRKHIVEEGAFVQNQSITFVEKGKQETILPVDQLQIPGGHNLENALAAVICAKAMGIPKEVIAHSLAQFKGVAHRLEFVAEFQGVRYVNDSKGTNPDASIKALEAYENPLVLIAGGKNKGNDFTAFMHCAAPKLRALVVLGQCADELAAKAKQVGIKTIHKALDFPSAVRLARDVAQRGDVVLLSPACASWDMFRSFEERGDLFKQLVQSFALEV